MTSTTDALAQVASDLRTVLADDALAGLSDAERAEVLRGFGEVARLVDAGVVETVATAEADFGHQFGCRGMNEFLQRVLLTDAATASKITRVSNVVRREVSIASGERLPAAWPRLREALLDGVIGVAGLLAATAPIERAHTRIGVEERLLVDEHLARYATGCPVSDEGSSGDDRACDAADASEARQGPPATPEDLRHAAEYLAAVLDPDGAEPSDRAAQARRSLSVGRLRNGVHPVRGDFTPELVAQLQLIFDAFNNPKVGGAPAPAVAFDGGEGDGGEDAEADPFNDDAQHRIDTRTSGQKRHDALAAALGIAARHDDMPRLGGAAPTLVVHVDAADLAQGTGWARLPGAEAAVPLSVARHTACTGAIQRVLFDEGRIIGITVTDRVFTVHQRRAIVARDRECLIPGCHVSASWCEIHHVTEHSRGGPTHTDNGVPLCWWHHRSLDTSGWEIRMFGGVPQIRGPAWWDPDRRWRTPRITLESLELAAARTG
ncbi:MAG: DUF222 domain-containing protein [Microbacterium sp.]|uniref:HNH endonuclease signature motif containing protein n=1 Tax=Microbacterium sp. TaxID=51671 RepID=UPI001D4858E1|nr:HNH endonuclease signature motif containing protein [Microbacterium sp.]MBW8761482.1 DUF222 domain-containing protein [Microbacterium sp.]